MIKKNQTFPSINSRAGAALWSKRIVATMMAISVLLFAVAAGCSKNQGSSGKSIFETATPSIFDQGTRTPTSGGGTTTPKPTNPPAPTPVPTTPVPRTPTPVPPTPTPIPPPTTLLLTLKSANPDLGTVSVEPQTSDNRYEKGTRVVISSSPNPGATFKGWSGDITSTADSLSVTMDSNKTIQAQFAKVTYALTVNQPTGGTISLSPAGSTFDSGANVTAKAVPAPGFNFQSWTGDAYGTDSQTTVTMDRAKTIGAQFVKAVYVLSVKVVPSGFVDVQPPGSRFDGGTVVTLTARIPMNSTMRFGSWSGGATGTDPTITVTMDSDKTVTANFITQYTLQIDVGPGGSVSPGPGTYVYDQGATVTLTATPNPGYQFSGWAGNVSDRSPTITVVMDRNIAALAAFDTGGG